MKKLLFLLSIILLISSCETYHNQSKLIMNNSDYSFELHTSNFHENDSIIFILPGQLIYLYSYQKLANHPNSLPTVPCSIDSDIQFNIICEGYVFVGNFYDEYNWEEDFKPGSQSHKHCRYDVDNKDFLIQEIKLKKYTK